MTEHLRVVGGLHGGRPPLSDVPARLEELAGQIRAGKIPAAAALVVLTDELGRLEPGVLRAYGAVPSPMHALGVLKLATDQFAQDQTALMPKP